MGLEAVRAKLAWSDMAEHMTAAPSWRAMAGHGLRMIFFPKLTAGGR